MPSDLKYPVGPTDKQAILEYTEAALRSSRSYRNETERAAQRNVLYYLGVQWAKFDASIRMWRPIAVSKRTPRPVTNRIASLVNQSTANILGFKPPITYSPASNRPDDIAAATVADRINAIIEREANIELLKPLVARWLTLTGNVFLISNYDVGPEVGKDFVGAEQCVGCGKVSMPLDISPDEQTPSQCPGCGAPGPFVPAQSTETMLPPEGMAVNPEGRIGVEYPRGRFTTEIENIFTCNFDNSSGQSIHDSPYFIVTRHRNKDWVTRMYGEEIANKVSYSQPSEPTTGLFESLAYATTIWSYGFGASHGMTEPTTRVSRVWLKPRPGVADEGIYSVIVGEEVVESLPWKYKDEQGKPMLNVTHIGYDEIPGRILYKSRVDDVIPKQDQRNRLESIMELHALSMANSVWLVPEGVGLSKITGQQGQVIKYNALANVPPPSRVSGDVISPYIPQWIVQIDNEMDALFGLYDVGRGEAPGKGVTSYSAIQLLDERAQQGQAGIMRNWARGWMEWSRQNLNIWRQYASEDRYLTTGQGQWSIRKFNKAALTGGVNITAELGTFRPQTQIAKRALFEQLVNLAIINPMDQMQKFELATAMGATELMPDFKSDMELHSRRIDQLVQGEQPPPPEPWENHPLAISIFRRFMQSEEFEGLPPVVQERIKWYGALHFTFMQMQAPPARPGQIAPNQSTGPGGEGKAKRGEGAESLPSNEPVLNKERQMPTHPQMAGRPT